jgi:hypothetical protein
MKYQANRNYISNDCIMTPDYLCKLCCNHFNPQGKILEPCKGTGNFLKYLPNSDYCEINEGKDFLQYNKKVDWIITNPPWSKIKLFLEKSLIISDNIVFLLTINHIFTKARLRLIEKHGFGIKEILFVDTPKEFPQMGFQLGFVYLMKNYNGLTYIGKLSNLTSDV